MIKYLTRDQIDDQLYNACIEDSVQSRIYAYSWYLDIVSENWSVLVLNNYEAVMPLPYKQKMGVKYVCMPFWVIQLGIFSSNELIASHNVNLFIDTLNKEFKSVDLRFNTNNYSESIVLSSSRLNTNHELSINGNYEAVYKGYKKDRRKDLRKAENHNLYIKEDNSADNLIELFKKNVGLRVENIAEEDYQKLSKLITICLKNGKGELVSVFEEEEIVAAAFLVKNNNRITIMVSSTDFKKRNNGANTFLIDSVIQKYSGSIDLFDFGGSSIPSIASYFKSFGAIEKNYYLLEENNLALPIKILKKIKGKLS